MQQTAAALSVNAPMDRTDMRRIAAAFHPGPGRPVTFAFRADQVPDGYVLVDAGTRTEPDLNSSGHFGPARFALAALRRTDRKTSGKAQDTYALWVAEPSPDYQDLPRTGTTCPAEAIGANRKQPASTGQCYRFLAGGKYLASAYGPTPGGNDVLIRMLDGLSLAGDPSRPETWIGVDQAIPASARADAP